MDNGLYVPNRSLYVNDVATLKDYGGIKSKITLHRALRQKGAEQEIFTYTKKGTVNEKKLDNNISRSKARVFEYAYCNPWEYFVTLTISPTKHDRTDIKGYYKKFNQWLRNYSKKHKIKLEYLFIPELHKDGKSWHMHGFLMGLPMSHLVENSNGYLDWMPYQKKFGWISLDKIRDRQKAASYITKYISKNLSDCIQDLGAKMYYNSRGLKTAELIKKGTLNCEFSAPDFENDWVKVKWYTPKVSIQSLKSLISEL